MYFCRLLVYTTVNTLYNGLLNCLGLLAELHSTLSVNYFGNSEYWTRSTPRKNIVAVIANEEVYEFVCVSRSLWLYFEFGPKVLTQLFRVL